MTPYYQDDSATIYHGDCREVLPRLSAAAVLTDPPYGVGKAEWDHEFPVWWFELAATAAPVLGVMPGVWNIARCPDRVGRLRYRWALAAHLVNGMTNGAIGFGNWIPLLVYTDEGTSLYAQETDCLAVVVGTDPKPDHPSPKPLRAMSWFVRRLTPDGGTILDPFMGSGTTLRAAKDQGRKSIGIEVEERYCEIAANRLQQEVLPFEVPA